MSRSSLPNLDYHLQDHSPSRLVGRTQGSPLVAGVSQRREVLANGAPAKNLLPATHTAPASPLAHILQERSSALTTLSVGHSMRQIEEEFLIPQAASNAVAGLVSIYFILPIYLLR
jgi:hypothetical protein